MNTDYTPNSHRFKEEQKQAAPKEKKVEKVVTGKVRVKKKNNLTKLADVFISEDISNVKSYILMDVLVPTIKKAISDTIKNSTDMIFGTGKPKSSSSSPYVSYRQYSDSSSDRTYTPENRSRSMYDYNDVELESYDEAKEVLDRLDELISAYGNASVADFYDLVDIKCNYTDNKYGWTNLSTADIVRARGGRYRIRLPRAKAFD